MGWKDSGWKSWTLFSGSCPSSATTQLPQGTAPGAGLLVGLSQMGVLVVDAKLLGPTGGTLDVYLQSSLDADQAGNGSWYDVCHFPQLAAATAGRFVATISRGYARIAATINAVNTVDNTPSLPVNTLVPDGLGNALRVVFVTGAGTSAAAAQTIKLGLSQ